MWVSSKAKIPFEWNQECELAFMKVKRVCCDPPIRGFIIFNLPLVLYTDACGVAAEAILIQWQRGDPAKTEEAEYAPRILGAYSATFKGPERRYPIAEQEALAVILSIRHWRLAIEASPSVTLYTDNDAVKAMLTKPDNARILRWALEIQHLIPKLSIHGKKGARQPGRCPVMRNMDM